MQKVRLPRGTAARIQAEQAAGEPEHIAGKPEQRIDDSEQITSESKIIWPEPGECGKETVYLAGKIAGDPDYRKKFYLAAQKLKAAGFIVLNPAMLPGRGFTQEAYLRICVAMLAECKSVCFLPDWEESHGATYEYGRAAALGKRIFFFDDGGQKE